MAIQEISKKKYIFSITVDGKKILESDNIEDIIEVFRDIVSKNPSTKRKRINISGKL